MNINKKNENNKNKSIRPANELSMEESRHVGGCSGGGEQTKPPSAKAMFSPIIGINDDEELIFP